MVHALTALGACAALALPGRAAAAEACPGARLRPRNAPEATIAGATLCLVNRIREAHGLTPLQANPELAAVAGTQVWHMLHWNYFADIRPGGRTPLSLVAGTRYPVHASRVEVGQNIAWGTGADAAPARIVAAWMASAAHRAIILDSAFRDAGVAAAPGVPSVLHPIGSGATYAMEFALRRR
jgi:uncharacterized protein YkwD